MPVEADSGLSLFELSRKVEVEVISLIRNRLS